ncbi:MAG: helical backbone metal receptor [Marinicellaceae bacterium]
MQKLNQHNKYYLQMLILCGFLLIYSCDSNIHLEDNSSESKNIKLITLAPHLAELVHSAGAINNLVGVVSYSDYPEQVKSIKIIGDAYKVDFESILALKPNYVLSWSGGTPSSTVKKLKSLNINVVDIVINNLSDIPKAIKAIAKLTGTSTFADKNISLFNTTIEELIPKKHTKQTAFIETFHQPLYTVSGKHWMSEAIEYCGYKNIFSGLKQKSATVSVEAVINKNPQIIINISKAKDQQWQKWTSLDAVKNNRILTIDPDYFSRPTMRILKGIEKLCSFQS